MNEAIMEIAKYDVIGLIPAGGRALRFDGFPVVKELLPIPTKFVNNTRKWVMIDDALGSFVDSRVQRVVIIVNENKAELISHINKKYWFTNKLQIEYVFQDINSGEYGLPYAIEMTAHIVGQQTVVLRFPDTVITSDKYLDHLLEFHYHSNSELTLGVFQTKNPESLGPVIYDDSSVVLRIEDMEWPRNCPVGQFVGIKQQAH
jgi:glucose-1-phosphate thymidylyltransferase